MSTLAPFQPSESNPWDKSLAAHLLNRAGFGALPEEVDQAVGWGLDRTVDHLVDFDKIPDTDLPPPEMPPFVDQVRKQTAGLSKEEQKKAVDKANRDNNEAIDKIRSWWVRRMIQTKRPLQEKMTLFWHGHLTTSAEDVRQARLLLKQNQFLRDNCLGNFCDLLLGISRDPAMLQYLNNNTNRKKHPNENYARELMELFSMGIGNYTEDDVKAAARAFTGWTYHEETFVFNDHEHDHGNKTYLGHSGDFDGSDVIEMILQQACTARFMAKKLLRFFVCDEPSEQEIDDLALVIRSNNYEFKPVLRALFRSQAFFSARAFRSQIKSPVQLVVGAARTLGVTVDEHALVMAMRGLGQDLLYPPTVKGWDGGETWINTQTLLLRYNFAGYLVDGEPSAPPVSAAARKPSPHHFPLDRFGVPKTQLEQICGREFDLNPAGLVDALAGRLLYASLDPQGHQWLLEQAQATPTLDRVSIVAHLIMSMPDYQIC
ncbi:MAG TPA: DUF1800 domain-containing protein [Verrucomicrobiae bacterium]|nr:DUF1800 domain-containing protein [Verrucomicrobiae bacterium]